MDNNSKLLVAAKLIQKHCDEHNFYEKDGVCEGCVFATGETCPFGDPVPADWEV